MLGFLDVFKNWFNVDGTLMANESYDINGKPFGHTETISYDWVSFSDNSSNNNYGSDF